MLDAAKHVMLGDAGCWLLTSKEARRHGAQGR
jgi:hypothetical protein